jgi:tripartite-type tricarboxylate transporter receptor subunit TctC
MKFAIALLAALVPGIAAAQYYAGKTVTVIVGYKTGGG